jgi:RHS repeat-associated protein
MTTDGTNGTIDNYGTIQVTGSGDGMECKNGGTVINRAIINVAAGPYNTYNTGATTNSGTITSGTTIQVLGPMTNNGTITTNQVYVQNAGTLTLGDASQVNTVNFSLQNSRVVTGPATTYATIAVTGTSTLASGSMTGKIKYCDQNGIEQNAITSDGLVKFDCNFVPFVSTALQRNPIEKQYEMSNHLGNVYVVISGLKIGRDTTGDLVADYYFASPNVVNDYYAFGAPLSGRSSNSTSYRYGFNGKEKTDEVEGSGDSYDYGMRIYDPRLGRFLSVDPLAHEYPWWTPYQFAGNNPIAFIDLDGAETAEKKVPQSKPVFDVQSFDNIYKEAEIANNTVHAIISKLDLKSTTYGQQIDINNTAVYSALYKAVSNRVTIVRIKGTTYVFPNEIEENAIKEFLSNSGTSALDLASKAAEGFGSLKNRKTMINVGGKLGKIGTVLSLKDIKENPLVVIGVAEVLGVLKVNPLVGAVISAVEPQSPGSLDVNSTVAEHAANEALDNLFYPKKSNTIDPTEITQTKPDNTSVAKRKK